MSAIRLHRPGEPLHLVDLGPDTPYRNPFAHPVGRPVEGRSGLNGHTDRAIANEYQRRYVARQRALEDPAYLESAEGQAALEEFRAEHRRHRRLEP